MWTELVPLAFCLCDLTSSDQTRLFSFLITFVSLVDKKSITFIVFLNLCVFTY